MKELLEAKPSKALEEKCVAVVKAPSESRNLRYMALRRLEEVGSPKAIETAREIACSTQVSDFLRLNAVGVLRRAAKSGNKEAQQALLEVSKDPALKQFALAK